MKWMIEMAEFSNSFYAPAQGLKRRSSRDLHHEEDQPYLPNEGMLGKKIRPTKHGSIRMQQRAISRSDVETIRRCGTLIGDLVYFLGNKDTDAEIGLIKQSLRALQTCNVNEIVCRSRVADDRARTSIRVKICEEKSALKQRIRDLARLRNRIAVIDGDDLISTYPARKKDIRRFRRRSFQWL
jgi:hypothetical protein